MDKVKKRLNSTSVEVGAGVNVFPDFLLKHRNPEFRYDPTYYSSIQINSDRFSTIIKLLGSSSSEAEFISWNDGIIKAQVIPAPADTPVDELDGWDELDNVDDLMKGDPTFFAPTPLFNTEESSFQLPLGDHLQSLLAHVGSNLLGYIPNPLGTEGDYWGYMWSDENGELMSEIYLLLVCFSILLLFYTS